MDEGNRHRAFTYGRWTAPDRAATHVIILAGILAIIIPPVAGIAVTIFGIKI
jgi:hypothetical protein